jgi:acyl-CoA thioester hydrolase
VYQKLVIAEWRDMDGNAHFKNTAYLDKSAHIRMMFFAEMGFPMSEFARLKVGPVIMKDEIEYYREIHLLEEIRVSLAVAGHSEDGGRFLFTNRFVKPDGTKVASVTSLGGWLDLSTRKLVPAPPTLLKVLTEAPRTDDFKLMAPKRH